MTSPVRRAGCALSVVLAVCATPSVPSADQLPVRTYTTEDGLASMFVHRIRRDTRGFLWFATREGLSRFDGARFVSYSVSDGLPDASVYDILETRDATYWVATNGGGVSRLSPEAGRTRLFTTYRMGESVTSNRVNVLLEDAAGTIWAGTDEGVYRLEKARATEGFKHEPLRPPTHPAWVTRDLAKDPEGNLWIATSHGLIRRMPDGRSIHYSLRPLADGTDNVLHLRVARDGRIWLSTAVGLIVFKPEPAADAVQRTAWSTALDARDRAKPVRRVGIALPVRAGEVSWFTSADGLVDDWVVASLESAGGQTWVATRGQGLYRLDASGFHAYARQEVHDLVVTSLLEDEERQLWIGTQTGALKLVTDGFRSYGPRDGLPTDVRAITEDREGRLYAVSGPWTISRIEQDRVVTMQPELPVGVDRMWASPVGFLDHEGGWWLLTTNGLYRLPRSEPLGDAKRTATPFPPEQPFKGNIFRLFEDAAGDIWICVRSHPDGMLARWQRSTDRVHIFTKQEGWSLDFVPSAFVEDRSGNIWIGSYNGGLARYSQGRFTVWTTLDGVPAGFVTALHVDQGGRIWMATNQQGVSRIDDATTDTPRFITYTTAQGLISNNVRCLTEDQWGRLYLGTGRGVDRLDPESGHVRHFGRGEGLAGEFVMAAHRDRSGTLWFGTLEGLSRYVPREDKVMEAPRIYLSAVSISGVSQPLSVLGETDLQGLTLAPDQNHMAIEFFALAPRVQDLRYQYRLADDSTWIDSPERAVRLARMSPGSYRFEVRALAQDRMTSSRPAVVAFTILRPFYARWWFVTLAIVTLGAIGYVMYRARVARLLDLERVRSRIATDLHDDIGASLSQIAMVSEVVRQRVGPDDTEVRDRLDLIASTSRDLVDSMSDVVWAINPARDSLSDLVHRMRRFANDAFIAPDSEVVFNAPSDNQHLRLGADVRREVFLIFKETINNCARHSGCTRVEVDFWVGRHGLTLRVRDNGCGFDQSSSGAGTGLASLRRRAGALGGTLKVIAAPGQGTTIELTAPLDGVRATRNHLFRGRPDAR